MAKEHSYLVLKKPAEVKKIIEDLMVAPPALNQKYQCQRKKIGLASLNTSPLHVIFICRQQPE